MVEFQTEVLPQIAGQKRQEVLEWRELKRIVHICLKKNDFIKSSYKIGFADSKA